MEVRESKEGRPSDSVARPVGASPITNDLPLGERQQMQNFYYEMLLIRRFEEKAGEMYTRAKMGGYVHLNIGEEATIVGAISVLRPDDYLFSNYRDHGHALVRGLDPKAVMAELYGKETGVCKGRGGSMHIFDGTKNFMGGYAIVAGQLPIAVGAALAIAYRHSDAVVLAMFGEGATNIGDFHEALNLAKIWHLPVVFFCVNNQYAMGSTVASDSAVTEIWRKACAYDMASEPVDGMDILAVRAVTERAIKHAREKHDPYFVEAITYRYRGHSMADPARYRTEEEVKQWRQRDPLITFRDRLLEAGLIDQATIDELQRKAERVVAEAIDFAESSPFPDPTTLYDDVYAEGGK